MKLYLAFGLLLLSASVAANTKAVTDEGDIVILSSDGTWVYENQEKEGSADTPLNPMAFIKDKSSLFLIKSKTTNSSFWINPKQWTFKGENNDHDSAEYTFKLKDGDLYGLAITEKISGDIEELTKIAYEMAKRAAPDIRTTIKEYRNVNGNKVIYQEMEGTVRGIKITYLGYYFSNSTGSTQYLTYTGTNLVSKYRKDIDIFLNGFATE